MAAFGIRTPKLFMTGKGALLPWLDVAESGTAGFGHIMGHSGRSRTRGRKTAFGPISDVELLLAFSIANLRSTLERCRSLLSAITAEIGALV
jgi:hypothetical protein